MKKTDLKIIKYTLYNIIMDIVSTLMSNETNHYITEGNKSLSNNKFFQLSFKMTISPCSGHPRAI